MPKEYPLPPKPRVMRSPGPSNRTLIVGRTGSGKSVAGLFHLSRQNFDEMPWTIVDSKEEDAFKQMRWLIPVDLDGPPPTKPGLYVIRPTPGNDEDFRLLHDYFGKVHTQGRHGLFIDEGYTVFPAKMRSTPLIAIFTQGRTRQTPVIMNSQRPSWIGREAISEASFIQVFDLTDRKDRQRVQEFIPIDGENGVDLMQDYGLYRSVYHDVGEKRTEIIKPVRPAEESVALIDKRLEALYRAERGNQKLRVI